jgi:hypothetical protein
MRLRFFVMLFVILLTAGWAQAQEQYFAIFMDGQKIGHVLHERTAEQNKVTTTEIVEMELSRGSIALNATQKQICYETSDGKPLGFDYSSDIGFMGQTFRAKIENGKLIIKSGKGQPAQSEIVDWPEGAVMAEGLRLLEKKTGLKEGSVVDAVTFDPETRTQLNATIKIGPKEKVDLLGRVVTLTRIDTQIRAAGGIINATDYVDNDLVSQKTIMPMMGMKIEMVACDKVFAMSKNDVVDFLDKAVIQSPIPLMSAENAKAIQYKIIPIGDAKLKFPATDNQIVKVDPSGIVSLTASPVKIAKGSKFPYTGNDNAALEALKPSRYVQSNAKEIIELSKKAVGNAKDSAEAAKRIESFVRQYISDKNLSVGYASALEVAQSKEGDCTEHAVLTAALCKAAGIPAQVVFGVLYIDEYAGKQDVFFGHAWTQAYVAGKWLQLDGTGHKIGPTRIAMAVGDGDPDEFFAIISTLGNFKIASATIEK